MSDENLNPDVVVVGMPSCGKTVFFTVLGKKFTNLVDGRRGAPLGFRLSTCDRNTASVVSVAYDRLRHRQWPEATKAGQIMPLRWEVFTGRRRIFELFSMDIAGETFKKTFDINDDDDGFGEGSKSTVPQSKALTIVDPGDELYRAESASGDSSTVDGGRETDEEKAAGLLKRAIETAKVVCFMVNIALPDGRGGKKTDDADERKLLRFRSSVMNMYLSLKESPRLRAKSMIILTQSHRHQGAIERAGGPVMYLGDVCGGEASELSNLARENDIPVIAVSAINETERGANELPSIESPYDIPSSGLFGFLLAVSGMVAHDDSLVGVKDAYIAYQRERVEYLKVPSQTVKIRLAQARKYREASSAFVNACIGYLDDKNNLDANGDSATPALSPSAMAMYRRFTREDPDVKTASDVEYLVRDELWDRVLRKAVVTAGPTKTSSIYDEVREGLDRAFPEKGGNDGNEEYVYGFGEEDLCRSGEAPTFNSWIELNLKEYRADFKDDIDALDGLKKKTIEDMASLATHVGGRGFDASLALVEKSHDEFLDKLSEFGSKWLDNGNVTFHDVSSMEEEVAEKYECVLTYKSEHERREKELRTEAERIRRDEELRQARIEASRRRRSAVAVLLLFVVIGVSMLLVARYYHDEKNRMTAQAIGRAVSRAEYAEARRLYDSLVSIKWLCVRNTDHLCPDFEERLALAEKCHEIRKSAEKCKARLEVMREWLDGIEASTEEVDAARKECSAALDSYRALPPLVSFNDIVQQGVDVKSIVLTAQKCESSLTSSIDKIEKMQKGWKERLRKEAFACEMQDARKQLSEISLAIDIQDLASTTNSIEEIDGHICKLQELAGADDVDEGRLEEFKESAGAVLERLRAKYEERRSEMFAKMLSDIRLAILSNSVSQAWEKYDAARGVASGGEECGKLEGLYEEVVGFTLNAYERALLEVEKTADMLRGQRSISRGMLARTRMSMELIEMVMEGLRRRIPEVRADFNRVESHAKSAQAKLPIVVQIDGVGQFDRQPMDIKNAGNDTARILNGISPDTQRQCLYLLVMRDELPSGSSLLVRIADAKDGKTYGVSIRLSDLVPGINRIEIGLRKQSINRKESSNEKTHADWRGRIAASVVYRMCCRKGDTAFS